MLEARTLFCALLLAAPTALAQRTAAMLDIAPFEDSIAQRMQAFTGIAEKRVAVSPADVGRYRAVPVE